MRPRVYQPAALPKTRSICAVERRNEIAAVMTAPRARDAAAIALLAAGYVVAGKLGLVITAVGGFATPVWAPSGLSLAALVLFGQRLWPGVALGALVVNRWAGASAGVALGISAGNTLEAVLGAYALSRVP